MRQQVHHFLDAVYRADPAGLEAFRACKSQVLLTNENYYINMPGALQAGTGELEGKNKAPVKHLHASSMRSHSSGPLGASLPMRAWLRPARHVAKSSSRSHGSVAGARGRRRVQHRKAQRVGSGLQPLQLPVQGERSEGSAQVCPHHPRAAAPTQRDGPCHGRDLTRSAGLGLPDTPQVSPRVEARASELLSLAYGAAAPPPYVAWHWRTFVADNRPDEAHLEQMLRSTQCAWDMGVQHGVSNSTPVFLATDSHVARR
jgi:hypothetical protein